MSVIPVQAYGIAPTFKLRELEPIFAGSASSRIEKDRLRVHFGDERYAIAYDFGAVVFVGVEAEEQERLVAALSRRLGPGPHARLTETFLIETGGAVETRFARVIVPELTIGVVEIVSEVLAQSVAMDRYANNVAEIEEATDRITSELRVTGRLPGRLRDLTKFIGLCIATRNDVISTLALFDKPDATWENEQLDRLWIGLHRMLEMDDRYRALEAKLRIFQDNLVVLVDLTRARHNFLLEMTIVVLILVEGLLMLWQILSATGHP